jgi:hypothetical protein
MDTQERSHKSIRPGCWQPQKIALMLFCDSEIFRSEDQTTWAALGPAGTNQEWWIDWEGLG